jgi:hypothetical protein
MVILSRTFRQLTLLPLMLAVNGCGSTVETQTVSEAAATPNKPLSAVTDHDWEECQQRAQDGIKGREPGPGLGDTGERAAYTYGGALGAIIALISAKSRSPETYTQEEQEERYYTYWKTLKDCLKNKGYIVSDDSVEVERP